MDNYSTFYPAKGRLTWTRKKRIYRCIEIFSQSATEAANAIPHPSTALSIEHYCRRDRVLHAIDDLPQSAKSHFIDIRFSEGNILLYFHGGGYNNPVVESGHVPLL